LRFPCIFDLQLVNRRLVEARLAAPTFVFSDWLSVWPKLRSAAKTSPPNILHQGPYGPCCTQPSLRMLHVFCNCETTSSWYLPTWCIKFCNYLVRHFRDGELRQSEALAEFSIIIKLFLERIPLQQNGAFASLKLLFIANRKQTTPLIHHCSSAIKMLIGQKSATRITDDLIDNWPLTDGGKTTFELTDNYKLSADFNWHLS